MARTVRACSFLDKGGTGKTTSIAHLSVSLVEAGHSVLAIDLAGKQGDLTKHFGLWSTVQEAIDADEDRDWPNVATVFDDRWSAIVDRLGEDIVEEMVYRTAEGVDVLPAHPSLDSLDNELALIDTPERYQKLDRFLTQFLDTSEYDVVLIDLPGLTNNVSYNGLWAAQNVIAPVEMGTFESEQAAALRRDVELFSGQFGRDLRLAMVLPNKIDERTTLDQAYLDQFAEEYPDAIAPSPVPRSQDIRNAAEQGRTIFAVEEPSTTAQRAREAYQANSEALLDRIDTTEVRQ